MMQQCSAAGRGSCERVRRAIPSADKKRFLWRFQKYSTFESTILLIHVLVWKYFILRSAIKTPFECLSCAWAFQCLSHFASCDQNIDLRAGSNPAMGIESQICIQKGYYVYFLFSCTENPRTPARFFRAMSRVRAVRTTYVSYIHVSTTHARNQVSPKHELVLS
jgi:hypothetical protein